MEISPLLLKEREAEDAGAKINARWPERAGTHGRAD